MSTTKSIAKGPDDIKRSIKRDYKILTIASIKLPIKLQHNATISVGSQNISDIVCGIISRNFMSRCLSIFDNRNTISNGAISHISTSHGSGTKTNTSPFACRLDHPGGRLGVGTQLVRQCETSFGQQFRGSRKIRIGINLEVDYLLVGIAVIHCVRIIAGIHVRQHERRVQGQHNVISAVTGIYLPNERQSSISATLAPSRRADNILSGIINRVRRSRFGILHRHSRTIDRTIDNI
mmetsp:Transcript_60528/g.69064  ORF Transcript_60528/g.69064 Transcript_60528/m.69064 type:complete len:236 (+) Transcript_60528:823-1530(+)